MTSTGHRMTPTWTWSGLPDLTEKGVHPVSVGPVSRSDVRDAGRRDPLKVPNRTTNHSTPTPPGVYSVRGFNEPASGRREREVRERTQEPGEPRDVVRSSLAHSLQVQVRLRTLRG